MPYTKVTIMVMGILLLAGSTSGKIQSNCCDGGYEYRYGPRFADQKIGDDLKAKLATLERDRQRLADELAAEQKQSGDLAGRASDLERQLADHDRELAALSATAGSKFA